MRDDEPIGVDERELDDAALEALAEAHAATPPSRLRARLLGTVSAERETVRARRSLTRWRVVGSIAAGLLVVTSWLLVRERARSEGQLAALTQQATQLSRLAA